jgi:hypothetical protein
VEVYPHQRRVVHVRQDVLLTSEAPNLGQQLLVGGELAESGETLLCTLDVGPADDALTIHEELSQELKVGPGGVLAVGRCRLEALQPAERGRGLTGRQRRR